MNIRPSSGRPGLRGGPARPSSGRDVGGPHKPSGSEQQQRVPSAGVRAQQEGKENKKTGSKMDKWDLQQAIDKGSFGTVYKAVNKEDGRLYAMKQVSLKGLNRADRQEAIDEARILASVDFPYITEHYDSFIEDDKLHIVMEFAQGGTLHAKLKANGSRGFPEDVVWKYFIQSLLALNYLHGKKIIHRDIKPLNLFLTEEGDIMMGDLGVARAMSDDTDFCRTILGTPYYLSPELCDDKPYNEKSDVWALGVVLYEMCMNVHPFTALNEGALVKKIVRGAYAPVVGYSPQMVDIVRQCLTHDYRRRPDTFALLRNAAVQNKADALKISLRPKPRERKKTAPRAEASVAPPEELPSEEAQPCRKQQQRQEPYNPSPPYDAPRQHGRQDHRTPGESPYAEWPAASGQEADWPRPAANDWPAPAPPPHLPPREMAAQQQRGAGGRLPGGVDPYQQTPLGRHPQRPDPQQMPAAGGRKPQAARASPLYADPNDGGALAYEMEQRMRMAEHEQALRAAVAVNANRGPPRGQHPAQQDHLGSVMRAGQEQLEDSYDWPRPGVHGAGRSNPDAMPAAGHGPRLDSRGGGPFAYDYDNQGMTRRQNEDDARLWQVSTPSHGRRRAVDLQITGPSLRGSPGRSGGGGHNGVAYYDPKGAITSTTTYASPSIAPSTLFRG